MRGLGRRGRSHVDQLAHLDLDVVGVDVVPDEHLAQLLPGPDAQGAQSRAALLADREQHVATQVEQAVVQDVDLVPRRRGRERDHEVSRGDLDDLAAELREDVGVHEGGGTGGLDTAAVDEGTAVGCRFDVVEAIVELGHDKLREWKVRRSSRDEIMMSDGRPR